MNSTTILTVFPSYFFAAKNHYSTEQILEMTFDDYNYIRFSESEFILLNDYIKQTMRNNMLEYVYFYLKLNNDIWERVGPSPPFTLHNNSQDDLEQDNTQEDP